MKAIVPVLLNVFSEEVVNAEWLQLLDITLSYAAEKKN